MTIVTDMSAALLAARRDEIPVDRHGGFPIWRMSTGALRALTACLGEHGTGRAKAPETFAGHAIVHALDIDGWELRLS